MRLLFWRSMTKSACGNAYGVSASYVTASTSNSARERTAETERGPSAALLFRLNRQTVLNTITSATSRAYQRFLCLMKLITFQQPAALPILSILPNHQRAFAQLESY